MKNTKNNFWKLWGMPIWMGLVTIMGLVFAIIGTGLWHALSWIALSVPLYSMVKHGHKFFVRKS